MKSVSVSTWMQRFERCCLIGYVALPLFLSARLSGLADDYVEANRRGVEAFERADYRTAADSFAEAVADTNTTDRALAHYNQAASLFKLGDLQKAQDGFRSAFAASDLDMQADAHFNSGNTAFAMAADLASKGELEPAIEQVKEAMEMYRNCIKLDPTSTAAIKNYEIAANTRLKLKEQHECQSCDKQGEKGEEEEKKEDEQKNESENSEESKEKNEDEKSEPEESPDQTRNGDEEEKQEEEKPDESEPKDQSSKEKNQEEEQPQPEEGEESGEPGEGEEKQVQQVQLDPEELKQMLQALLMQEQTQRRAVNQRRNRMQGRVFDPEKDW